MIAHAILIPLCFQRLNPLLFLSGTTPLHASASQDNVQICRILVESKADVTRQDYYCSGDGNTPLDIAISYNRMSFYSGVVAYLRKQENLGKAGTSSDGQDAVLGSKESKCVAQ